MKLLEDWGALVSTNCECIDETEEGEEVPADYCQGCGEWMTEGVLELIEEWLERNNHPSAVMIQGVAMTWQRLSGYALIRATGDKIASETLDKLMINGDFTITLKLEGGKLTATRSSHDEPTGCSFTVSAFMPCDGSTECMAIDGLGNYDGRVLCGSCAEWEGLN